jgi:hypothetical protein
MTGRNDPSYTLGKNDARASSVEVPKPKGFCVEDDKDCLTFATRSRNLSQSCKNLVRRGQPNERERRFSQRSGFVYNALPMMPPSGCVSGIIVAHPMNEIFAILKLRMFLFSFVRRKLKRKYTKIRKRLVAWQLLC